MLSKTDNEAQDALHNFGLHSSRNGGLSTETEPPKVELLGFASDDEAGEPAPLRLNRFRPEAGIRSRLRNRLHEVLEDSETVSEDDSNKESTSGGTR